MHTFIGQLKELKLHGMAKAATDMLALKNPPDFATGLRQLIEAEATAREVRSMRYQLKAARFPHHKDFATFDYNASALDKT